MAKLVDDSGAHRIITMSQGDTLNTSKEDLTNNCCFLSMLLKMSQNVFVDNCICHTNMNNCIVSQIRQIMLKIIE